jgi:N utilization substance protein B
MDETIAQSKDPRHLARLLALQFLYSKYFSKKYQIDSKVFEPQSLLEAIDEKKFDKNLYIKIIEGVEVNEKKIDDLIQEVAPQWPIEELNPINLIILRIGIWEGFIGEITPPKVAINEAIELDKSLSNVSNSGFINGVLGNIYADQNLQKTLKDSD